MKAIRLFFLCMILPYITWGQSTFNGVGVNMGNLYKLSDAKTRSISPENFTGEKGDP